MSIIKVHYYQNHPLMSVKTLLSLCLYLHSIPVFPLPLAGPILLPIYCLFYYIPTFSIQFQNSGYDVGFFNGPLQHHFEFYWCTPYV